MLLPKKLDDCVEQLVADPDFKPEDGQDKKSAAFAVCTARLKSEGQELSGSEVSEATATYSNGPSLGQDHEAVNYIPQSKSESEICASCRFWVAPESGEKEGGCTIVEGVINPDGYCDLFDEAEEVTMETKYKKAPKDKTYRKESYLKFEATPSVDSETGFTGAEWKVRFIEAGVSLNKHDYPLDVLHAARGSFEGVPVHAAIGQDHSAAERGVKSLVGFIKDVESVPEGLEGTLHISDTALRATLLDFHEEGVLSELVGLSIVADGYWQPNGNGIEIAKELLGAHSVDLVRSAAAGGKFLEVSESKSGEGEDSMTLEMTEEKVKEISEEAAKSAVEALLVKQKEESDKDKEGEVGATSATSTTSESTRVESTEAKELLSAAQQMNTLLLRNAISEAKLPDNAAERITSQFEDKAFDGKKVQDAIAVEKDYLASHEKTVVEGLTNEKRLILTVDEGDKTIGRIRAMFTDERKINVKDGDSKTSVAAFKSFREAYCTWYSLNPYEVTQQEIVQAFMGGRHGRGLGGYDSADKAGNARLYTEAPLQTTDLAQVVGDVMHKMLILNYNSFPQYQDWRKVARILTVDDYQAHRQIKLGGYANLPVVAERGVYNDLAHPADEESTVTLQKRGGIASQITRELIINDNVQAIAQIPKELALAAARTLYQTVFDIFSTNDTYGVDSTALFVGGHSNTGTTALSIAGIDAAQLAMRSQTRALSTPDVLGASNLPRLLLVPNELQGLAERIVNPSPQFHFNSTADTDAHDDPMRFSGQMEPIVVDYWTDATEYFLVADPSLNAGIGVAFLNGNEEPELFIQADERVGETFTQDVQNIKIRFEYREVIMDYRPFYRQT